MINILKSGRIINKEKLFEFKKELEEIAVERIELVRCLWGNLKKDDNKRSFANLWVEGIVNEYFDNECFNKSSLWKGLVARKEIKKITKLSDINRDFADRINDLIEDTINYISWTL